MPISFQVVHCNIESLKIEAVVNSANTSLRKGSGICRNIYNYAGESQLTNHIVKTFGECFRLMPGEAILTPGFDLAAKYIIHTVTPKYYIGDKAYNVETLSSCYAVIIKIAAEYGINSIGIPCLGVGHHCWPLELSATIALDTLIWLSQSIDEKINVIFCCYNDEQFACYQRALHKAEHNGN